MATKKQYPRTHMSGAFIFRKSGDEREVLLIKQEFRDGGHVWKPPCGTNSAYLKECPEETLDRVVFWKTGLSVLEGKHVAEADQFVRKNPELKRGPHTKRWYLITEYEGNLRTGEIYEDNEVLEPPQWVPVREALDEKAKRAICSTHRDALIITLKKVG